MIAILLRKPSVMLVLSSALTWQARVSDQSSDVACRRLSGIQFTPPATGFVLGFVLAKDRWPWGFGHGDDFRSSRAIGIASVISGSGLRQSISEPDPARMPDPAFSV